MSAPDMNALPPADVRTRARRSSTSSRTPSTSWRSSTICRLRAFRVSGRLSVTTATPSSSRARRIVSYVMAVLSATAAARASRTPHAPRSAGAPRPRRRAAARRRRRDRRCPDDDERQATVHVAEGTHRRSEHRKGLEEHEVQVDRRRRPGRGAAGHDSDRRGRGNGAIPRRSPDRRDPRRRLRRGFRSPHARGAASSPPCSR